MPLLFLKNLLNPKIILAILLVVVIGFFGYKAWNFVDQAIEDRTRIVQQETVIQLKDAEIDTLQEILDQSRRAANIAQEAQIQAENKERELRSIRDRALNSGDENDGPIAPVLRDALRGISDSMR